MTLDPAVPGGNSLYGRKAADLLVFLDLVLFMLLEKVC
jgi:hypothetical protein